MEVVLKREYPSAKDGIDSNIESIYRNWGAELIIEGIDQTIYNK